MYKQKNFDCRILPDYILIAMGIREANTSNDLRATAKAQQFYKKLIQYVSTGDNYQTDRNGTPYVFSRLIDPQYDDLLIVLNQMDDLEYVPGLNGTAGYAMGSGRFAGTEFKIIKVPALKPNGEFNGIDESSFIHEFIHYLDDKRKGSTKKSAGTAALSSREAYYNDPDEFNAFFQEGLRKVWDLKFSTTNGRWLYKDELTTFDKFYKEVIPLFDVEFVKTLNAKYRRKLVLRLHKAFDEFKRRAAAD